MNGNRIEYRAPRRWNLNADPTKNDNDKSKSKLLLRQRIGHEVIAWFWVALAFMLINGTIGQARVIPSGSMENTLLIGDHLIMSRIGYDAGVPFTNWHVPLWRNPQRRQVIIFKPPFAPDTTDLIKRTIGLPGDTVDLRGGAVFINGQKLNESYAVGPTEPAPARSAPTGFSDIKFPYHVPDNCYFAMGDNRTNSYDSRFWGCVPRNDIIGTPVMIYMSLDVPSDAWEPGQTRERFLAYASAVVHPGVVRWKRLFHLF
jgi:signal peptidase I